MYTDYVYPTFVSLPADISCLLFLFRKCCCFVFLSFPLLFHNAFFFSFFFYIAGLLAISYPLVSLPFYISLFVCICLHPDALSSVVLISDLLYQSAAFVFLDGSRVSEGLVKVSEGILLHTVNTVDGCEIILCGAFNARTADRSCLTISIDDK